MSEKRGLNYFILPSKKYALEAFVYKASRASKKVGLKNTLKTIKKYLF